MVCWTDPRPGHPEISTSLLSWQKDQILKKGLQNQDEELRSLQPRQLPRTGLSRRKEGMQTAIRMAGMHVPETARGPQKPERWVGDGIPASQCTLCGAAGPASSSYRQKIEK